MVSSTVKSERVFKTAWFAKAARRTQIYDDELCSLIEQVWLGQADDLGGGIFKKRIKKNQYRAIILTRTGHFWIYEYLFSKQDRANIEDNELSNFRKLAKAYNDLTEQQVWQLLQAKDWVEICDGNKT